MMEIGNVINVLNQPKTPTLSIMDLGKQLLEYAKDGQTSKVHDLMCRGAPFTTDWLGKSALHMAAENNHYDTCGLLLRAGISKDSRTKVERTPLHLAVCNGHGRIVKLLLEHKCDVDARDMLRYTPLHWAVEEDYPYIVKVLLKYGADPHAEAKDGGTPISIARARNYNDSYHLLTTYKYQPSVSLQEQQEATDSLMQEMEKDSLGSFKHSDVDISQDSTSCDDMASSTLHGNLSSSSSQHHNSSTLQLLQDELPVDDTNNFLQSAFACGRQIVVTELGKQMLKVQNSNANANLITRQTATGTNSMAGKNGDAKQKSVGILIANSTATAAAAIVTTPKVLTKPNIVKRITPITPEEWSKLCGEGKIKTVASPNVLTTANGAIRFQKCRLMQKVNINSDSSSVSTAATVKVINKPTLSNNPMSSAVKKMIIKSEPPQLTNFPTANHSKTSVGSNMPVQVETIETKMVQIPLPDYTELVTQLNELKERVATLEEHCEKCTGFIRNKSTSQH